MNKKQIIILTVILIILTVGLVLKFSAQRTDTKEATEVYSSLPFSFDPEKVREIRIGRGPEAPSVDLVKQNGQWDIRSLWGAKADEEKINELLNAVSGARGELRSAEKALFKDFGIDDANAFSLKLNDLAGIPVLDLKIGSQTAGSNGFFVRKEDSPEVYLVEEPFDKLLGIFMSFEEAKPGSNFWADLTLFDLDPEAIKKIKISRFENGSYILVSGVERLDGKKNLPGDWKTIGSSGQGEVDPEKVLGYIATLNSIRAKAVVDPGGEEYGLEKPAWRLEVIEGDSDREFILEAGSQKTEEGIYFIKFSGDPHVFSLASDFFEDLDVKNEKFFKTEPELSAQSSQDS